MPRWYRSTGTRVDHAAQDPRFGTNPMFAGLPTHGLVLDRARRPRLPGWLQRRNTPQPRQGGVCPSRQPRDWGDVGRLPVPHGGESTSSTLPATLACAPQVGLQPRHLAYHPTGGIRGGRGPDVRAHPGRAVRRDRCGNRPDTHPGHGGGPRRARPHGCALSRPSRRFHCPRQPSFPRAMVDHRAAPARASLGGGQKPTRRAGGRGLDTAAPLPRRWAPHRDASDPRRSHRGLVLG